jgi:hypothetical protein
VTYVHGVIVMMDGPRRRAAPLRTPVQRREAALLDKGSALCYST